MQENTQKEQIATQEQPLIEMVGAKIENEGSLILSDVNITIKKGELVYLVGRVGSGKSSIIKTLIGELPVAGGSVSVCGYKLEEIKRKQIPFLRRSLGVVFQDFQLLAERTVMENLRFVLEVTGWSDAAQIDRQCERVLRMVGMETKFHKLPHQLSGGEQQRIAIARALLNSPKVILADEPTGNLDAETADGIMNLILRIHNEYSPAVLIVTHNRSIIEKFPGRILLCAGGECREVFETPDIEEDLPDDKE